MGETQESIVSWMHETFPGGDPESPRKALRALEEMVELCMAFGASGNEVNEAALGAIDAVMKKRLERQVLPVLFSHGRPTPDEIPAEAADVLIVLYGVAGLRGFDLHAEVEKKMAINRYEREWIPRGDGTGYHKKTP